MGFSLEAVKEDFRFQCQHAHDEDQEGSSRQKDVHGSHYALLVHFGYPSVKGSLRLFDALRMGRVG